MKPRKAIAILSMPFAILWLGLFGLMFLIPCGNCYIESPMPTHDIFVVILVIIAITFLASTIAALVLTTDLFLIRKIFGAASSQASASFYRYLILVLIGATTATFPGVIINVMGGQRLDALNPQLEYLPYAISGAIIFVILDKLVKSE